MVNPAEVHLKLEAALVASVRGLANQIEQVPLERAARCHGPARRPSIESPSVSSTLCGETRARTRMSPRWFLAPSWRLPREVTGCSLEGYTPIGGGAEWPRYRSIAP